MKKRMVDITVLLGLVTIGWSGCDAAANGQFQGKPLMHVQAVINGQPSPAPKSPHVGVMWVDFSAGVSPREARFLGEVLAISSTLFPAKFTFDLFATPPDAFLYSFTNIDGTIAAEFAFGTFFVLDDANQDQQFAMNPHFAAPYSFSEFLAPPDRLLGHSRGIGVFYFKTVPADPSKLGPDAWTITNWDQATPGYQLATLVSDTSDLSKPPALTILPSDTLVEMKPITP